MNRLPTQKRHMSVSPSKARDRKARAAFGPCACARQQENEPRDQRSRAPCGQAPGRGARPFLLGVEEQEIVGEGDRLALAVDHRDVFRRGLGPAGSAACGVSWIGCSAAGDSAGAVEPSVSASVRSILAMNSSSAPESAGAVAAFGVSAASAGGIGAAWSKSGATAVAAEAGGSGRARGAGGSTGTVETGAGAAVPPAVGGAAFAGERDLADGGSRRWRRRRRGPCRARRAVLVEGRGADRHRGRISEGEDEDDDADEHRRRPRPRRRAASKSTASAAAGLTGTILEVGFVERRADRLDQRAGAAAGMKRRLDRRHLDRVPFGDRLVVETRLGPAVVRDVGQLLVAAARIGDDRRVAARQLPLGAVLLQRRLPRTDAPT